MISFTVYGLAQPGGSKRGFIVNGRAVITDANAKVKDWRTQVVNAAVDAKPMGAPLLDGPLCVTMRFYRPRPAGHYLANGCLSKTGRETTAPATRPDVLKLARAVEDSLSGILWRDDAQIVEEHLYKHYGEPARVEVQITGVPVLAEDPIGQLALVA
jgi:Holliday junction resolvase RusA-like endonuclease